MTKHVPFSSRFLRAAGYINGAWTAGGATKTFDVINPATGEVTEGFALVTKAANETIAPIHDRMPVILRTPGAVKKWLNPATPLAEINALMAGDSAGLILTPAAALARPANSDLPEDSGTADLFGNLP